MEVVAQAGREDIAIVYIAKTHDDQLIEFVESIDPPHPREDKWVNIISTLFGCPVGCKMCDAGKYYSGKLSTEDMLWQIDHLIQKRWPGRVINTKKWKLQFARMGEPALNNNVLEVLRKLPELYDTKSLIPSVSTIAPASARLFLEELKKIKHEIYRENFQFQFSLHSCNEEERNKLIPVRTMSFAQMGDYGREIFNGIGRKITLNFALISGVNIDTHILKRYFDTDSFLIKLTPMNPTFSANENGLASMFDYKQEWDNTVDQLREAGYEVLESIGELEENAIGSNCGQYISAIRSGIKLDNHAYSYKVLDYSIIK